MSLGRPALIIGTSLLLAALVGLPASSLERTVRAAPPAPIRVPGPLQGPLSGGPEVDCGDLLLNSDEFYDGGGYGWQYGGVQRPFYGAWAESYTATGEVCGAVFDFTRNSPPAGRRMDVYVWQDAGGRPGTVTCVEPEVDPGPVAWFPYVSRHVVPLSTGCCVESTWWIGFWGNWPGEHSDWLVAADQDSDYSQVPLMNIAPGLGYPTGWQNVSVVWGATSAVGIGAMVRPCGPTPTVSTTWGRVKTLYR
jgi:hypothetical protein